jgi:hypothetical protein
MTTRLYCRDCGWHPVYRRQRAALRAARRHRCPDPPPPDGDRPHHLTGSPTPDTMGPRTAAGRQRSQPQWWTQLLAILLGETICARTMAHAHRPDTAGPGRRPDTTGDEPLPTAGQTRERFLRDYHAETTRRSHAAVEQLVRAGYHLGPVPYGYRAERVRVTQGDGRTRTRRRLVADGRTGPVVRLIFAWRVQENLSYATIAGRLTADPARCPAPSIPATGAPGVWSTSAVRRILSNPRYTGRQIWGRRQGTRAAVRTPTISVPGAHPPLVDEHTFTLAQSARSPRASGVPLHTTTPAAHPDGPTDIRRERTA